MQDNYYYSYFADEEADEDKLHDSPKVTELISGRDKMGIQLSPTFSQSKAKGKVFEAVKIVKSGQD